MSKSMLDRSPRNLSLEQQHLVRSFPPPADEVLPLAPPTPGRVVPLIEVGVGPRRFAAAAERAGFVVHAVASHGPLLNSDGGSTRDVHVVSVRCADGRGQVQIAAAWADGKFDVAFGRRTDDGRRVTGMAREARAWLDHGVEGDVPDMRDAARFVVRALGATMIGVKVTTPEGPRFVAPEPRDDEQARDHLLTVHGVTRTDTPLTEHAMLHAGSQNHRHDRWPLGEPVR